MGDIEVNFDISSIEPLIFPEGDNGGCFPETFDGMMALDLLQVIAKHYGIHLEDDDALIRVFVGAAVSYSGLSDETRGLAAKRLQSFMQEYDSPAVASWDSLPHEVKALALRIIRNPQRDR